MMGEATQKFPDLADLPAIAEGNSKSVDLATLAARSEPMVFRGLVADWPIVAAASKSFDRLSSYLSMIDSGTPVPVMEAPASASERFAYGNDVRDYTFTRRQRPLAETLGRIERLAKRDGSPTIAIQMLAIDRQMPRLLVDNPLPLVPSGATPKLWLGGRVRTQIHHDRDHNLACVVGGRRRFLLFPPDQVANLYIGPPDQAPPLSLVDPEQPDLRRFPRFALALDTARVAVLQPGDAIFIPRLWWHHVVSLDAINALVNFWWGQDKHAIDDPRQSLFAAILNIRGLPPAERDYWRAMFDAVVFGSPEEAGAHLPPGQRAWLGELDPTARSALRREVLNAFSRSDRHDQTFDV